MLFGPGGSIQFPSLIWTPKASDRFYQPPRLRRLQRAFAEHEADFNATLHRRSNAVQHRK